MKKKILFMVINMNIGGTEKALLNLISELPKEKFDTTILMLEKNGRFLDYIPGDVKVEHIKDYQEELKMLINMPIKTSAKSAFKKRLYSKAFTLLIINLYTKITKDSTLFFKYILKDYPKLMDQYDLAVAFAGPMDFISYFVANKIKAQKKIQWIHFDVSKVGFNKGFASKVYQKFYKIFVVSEEGKNILIKKLPKLKYHIDTFNNIVSQNQIIKMADSGKGFDDDFNGIRILTVGRLSLEKGQDVTIEVLAKLKNAGYNVRWYCIGEGNAREYYEELITKSGLREDYILLGSNPNPYPFMKQCDLYVQPSRHEGYCITLAEARCFNNPIISTNFTGVSEQIKQNETGVIVPFDENSLFDAIKKVIDNGEIRVKFKQNLEKEIARNYYNDTHKLLEIVNR